MINKTNTIGHQRNDGFFAYANMLVAELAAAGAASTARRYGTAVRSLSRFTGGRELGWPDLQPWLLTAYENHLKMQGLCRNSTSFYMRALRAICNRAAEAGVEVPHGAFRHVYTGIDCTRKRAIPLAAVRRIRDTDLSLRPALDFARQMFMFSFYTRGMAFVDIAYLRRTDICGNVLAYRRRKTGQSIRVVLEEPACRIIAKYGCQSAPWLFPILTNDTSGAPIPYNTAYHRINRNLAELGRLLGLETKLTTYVARHAWASTAMRHNVPLATISRAMGHVNEKTTLIYLDSLDTAAVDEANHRIISLM